MWTSPIVIHVTNSIIISDLFGMIDLMVLIDLIQSIYSNVHMTYFQI